MSIIKMIKSEGDISTTIRSAIPRIGWRDVDGMEVLLLDSPKSP